MSGEIMIRIWHGSCGWWLLSLDGALIAKFSVQVDANMYASCCIESGHALHATLASGVVI
jgi:hypothetical protein